MADVRLHRVDDVILEHTIETTQLKDGGRENVNRVEWEQEYQRGM